MLLLRSAFVDGFSDPELCYADIALCRGGSGTTLYVSDDGGDTWARVDPSGVTAERFDTVLAADDGRVVALAAGAAGTEAWAWPAGVDLPTVGEPEEPTADVVFPPEPYRNNPGYITRIAPERFAGAGPWTPTQR